jgi:hypothetical protein
MALGSTWPLTGMSTRNMSCGIKTAGVYGWPYHLHVPTVRKSGSLNLLGHSGPVQTCRRVVLSTFVWEYDHRNGEHIRNNAGRVRRASWGRCGGIDPQEPFPWPPYSREILNSLWKPKCHYCVSQCSTLDPTLSQTARPSTTPCVALRNIVFLPEWGHISPLISFRLNCSYKKVKGRLAGSFQHCSFKKLIVLLPLIHLQRRHHTKRCEGPLLAKEGTFIEGIVLEILNLL